MATAQSSPPFTPLTLAVGHHRVEVVPEEGGRIARFYTNQPHGETIDWLRPLTHLPDGRLLGGCFALWPYANRIDHGHFHHEDRSVHLPAHALSAPHSLHGVGWLQPWDCITQHSDHLHLRQVTDPSTLHWPWHAQADQHITLTDTALTLRLCITNRDPRPMPTGAGFHPYFPLESLKFVHSDTKAYWSLSPDHLPLSLEEVDTNHSFNTPRAFDDFYVDTLYEGWSGNAQISRQDTPKNLRLSVDPAGEFLHIFRPQGRDFFCLEPVSHRPNAHNQPEDSSLIDLHQGDQLSFSMTLTIES